MQTIYGTFSLQLRSRLRIASIGLGLVRLLQDAGRAEEARAALTALESGFQDSAKQSGMPGKRLGRRKRGGLEVALPFTA